MPIQIFSGIDDPQAAPDIEAMFEDRKRIFVDLLNWDVPVLADRYEVDQFDTTDAIYLVEAEDGEHYGSIRLLPTDVPHILGSLFPYLCDGRVPAGADVLEITRGCLSPRLRGAPSSSMPGAVASPREGLSSMWRFPPPTRSP